jgi:hypothetical protein
MKNTETGSSCPVCGSPRLKVFYEVLDVPASCNILWASKDAAVNCPKGHLRLAFCPVCTFATNLALEPEKNQYGHLYDNSLFYSQHFQNFAKELAANLIQRYNLHNKTIVEIGCGKVDFLSLFCELGNNTGLRFNPAQSQGQTEDRNRKDLADSIPSFNKLNESLKADFVFSYHELEHWNYPKSFLIALRQMISNSPHAKVFFAVPNAKKSFYEGDYTDIIYEHVSYFTVPSLYFLFHRCGFNITEVVESENAIFDSIYINATPEKQKQSVFKLNSQSTASEIEDCINLFSTKSSRIIERHNNRIKKLLNKGKRLIMWGAGARGVTLLNIIKDRRIEYAVDINPRKQGMYIPGTGQSIVDANFLIEYKPDYIIVANPAYENEIRQIISNLEIKTEFILI